MCPAATYPCMAGRPGPEHFRAHESKGVPGAGPPEGGFGRRTSSRAILQSVPGTDLRRCRRPAPVPRGCQRNSPSSALNFSASANYGQLGRFIRSGQRATAQSFRLSLPTSDTLWALRGRGQVTEASGSTPC
jgi:hypothetical protein